MKLSIVIPVYNVESFLPECLDSILMQDLPENEYEIIAVNDNSPDNSLTILEDYRTKHRNIKIISQENGGISDARNTGIKNAEGEYLVLLDSDDFYSSIFFKDIFDFIKSENQPDMVLFNFNYYYAKQNKHVPEKRLFTNKDLKNKNGQEVLEMILSRDKAFSWYAWTMLIKTKVVKDNDLYFIKNRNYEDMMWTPLIFCFSNSIAYFDKPVLEYRLERDGQITGTVNFKNIADPVFAPDIVINRLKALKINQSLKNKLLRNLSSKYFIAFLYGGLLHKNERYQLMKLLQDHKHLMKYADGRLYKNIARCVKLIGHKNTLQISGTLFPLYRKFKGSK